MIAKIIASGRDRDEALARLRRAMAETTVVIEGGATNKSFILDLLDQPEVIDGSRRHRLDRPRPRRGPARLAPPLRRRARRGRHRGLRGRRAGRAHPPARDRPRRPPAGAAPVGRAVDLKLRGTAYKVTVLRIGPHRFRVTVANGATSTSSTPTLDRIDEYASRLTVEGRAPPPHHRHPRAGPPRRGRRRRPTGSAATRAACCARPRRRWSWRPRRRSATRSPPARRCSSSSR